MAKKWFNEFRHDRTSTEGVEHFGRLTKVARHETVTEFEDIVLSVQIRRLELREMVEALLTTNEYPRQL